MKLFPSSRGFAALLTLVCLLFTQLAVASYACPSLGFAQSASNGDMPGCGAMDDMDQPGLCKAHCEVGHQALDTPGTPQVQPFVAAALALVLVPGTRTEFGTPWRDTPRLSRTTAPPLTIRNCCFRI